MMACWPQPDDLRGEEADPDDAENKATGLFALGEIDDIAIVALPDGGRLRRPSSLHKLPIVLSLTPSECVIASPSLTRRRPAR